METRANYVLIGAFTLAGILGALGFFVWLANSQVDREFAYYNVLFDNVSGLTVAGNVSFNGVSVGQVTSIDLYDKDPSKVIVGIQVAQRTPVKTDTTAQLKSQGVTGMSFIEMAGGSPDAPRLEQHAVIVAQRSVVQALSEDAPNLLKEAITLLHSVQGFVGPDKQEYVAGILRNLDAASGKLETALGDFSSVTKTVASASDQIGAFTARLDEIGGSVEATLDKARGTLDVAKGAFSQAEATLATATTTLIRAGTTFDSANAVIKDQVPPIVDEVGATVKTLNQGVADIKAQVATVLASIGGTSQIASERLIELQGTIAKLEATLGTAQTTLEAVTAGSQSVQKLVDGEGTGLVVDARTTLANANQAITSINKVVQEDMPVIVSDVRTATANANATIEQVGNDLTGASGQLTPLIASGATTLAAATRTFRDASSTLNRLQTSLDTVDSTLIAAKGTFTSANTIIETEVAPTAADIRTSAANLNKALASVTADLPTITADIQSTIARADAVVAQVDKVVATSGPQINSFAQAGLPEFVAFAQEARNLVAALDRLTAKVQRDPARFFFGNQPPDFRR
ncbi:MAG: MlaD family protein [Amaricoccus sp.]